MMLGMTIGGVLLVYLLSLILEWALFKRIVDTPQVGISLSVASAVIVALILYGFGNADGGNWNPLPGGIFYVVGGAIVVVLRLWSYRRRAADTDNEVAESFE